MRFHRLEESIAGPLGAKIIGHDHRTIAGMVRDSQKFYMGDADLWRPIAAPENFPRLPFDACTFEFETTQDGAPPMSAFILAIDSPDGGKVLLDFFHPTGRGDYYLGAWMEADRERSAYEFFVNMAATELLGAPSKLLHETGERCASLLARFLSVLNCSNVQQSTVAAPEALNRKRTKTGKPPIYSYRVLVLTARQRRIDAGGTHGTPRVHLRRGHIKRRATGSFWWQPCVVGNKERGVVVKDYRADKLSDFLST